MPFYRIQGGVPLYGDITPSGSKNAALPILAASLLTKKPVTLSNIPNISDIQDMNDCLSVLGKKIQRQGLNQVEILESVEKFEEDIIVPLSAQKFRGSILLLGPLLARYQTVYLPLPGGCNIGERPIDQHIKAMEALGIEIIQCLNHLKCRRQGERLKGAGFHFQVKTVTGTENAIMAAVLAEGVSHLSNIALEPEVVDLINFLNQMGAKISSMENDSLEIIGVEFLSSSQNYRIIADRIEAGTWLIAAAMTQGSISIKGVEPQHLESPLKVLSSIGAKIHCDNSSIQLSMSKEKGSNFVIKTQPYPGFPTDLQPLFLSLGCLLSGKNRIEENLFENRFKVAEELKKMGAKICTDQREAIIQGREKLVGAVVSATDLRAGAALVCAALAAQGESFIMNIEHILRGYENFAEKLRSLGAKIEEVDDLTSKSTVSDSKEEDIHPNGFFAKKLSPATFEASSLQFRPKS